MGGEHSGKEPLEQLVMSYSEYLHMSARPVENARDRTIIIERSRFRKVYLGQAIDMVEKDIFCTEYSSKTDPIIFGPYSSVSVCIYT